MGSILLSNNQFCYFSILLFLDLDHSVRTTPRHQGASLPLKKKISPVWVRTFLYLTPRETFPRKVSRLLSIIIIHLNKNPPSNILIEVPQHSLDLLNILPQTPLIQHRHPVVRRLPRHFHNDGHSHQIPQNRNPARIVEAKRASPSGDHHHRPYPNLHAADPRPVAFRKCTPLLRPPVLEFNHEGVLAVECGERLLADLS